VDEHGLHFAALIRRRIKLPKWSTVKLWSYLRQILSGLVTYIALVLTINFAIFVVVPLGNRPITQRDMLQSLLSLCCFAVFAALDYFLYKKLCRGARLAWWTANICTLFMLLLAIYAFWFAIHYRGDFERTDGSTSFFVALMLGSITLVCFVALYLPVTRKYCGVSHA
jgi:hypothetical protein